MEKTPRNENFEGLKRVRFRPSGEDTEEQTVGSPRAPKCHEILPGDSAVILGYVAQPSSQKEPHDPAPENRGRLRGVE